MSAKTIIELFKGDITSLSADAIVNAANQSLLGGGGVDGAIHRAAGPELLAECRTLGGCKTGQAKITGGYNLPAKHVIHTVGPIYDPKKAKEKEGLLADCYLNSLDLAEKNGIRTIAFPSISTGAYRFPIEQAAAIAVKTVRDYIKSHPRAFDRIIFVVFSDTDQKIYQSILE